MRNRIAVPYTFPFSAPDGVGVVGVLAQRVGHRTCDQEVAGSGAGITLDMRYRVQCFINIRVPGL